MESLQATSLDEISKQENIFKSFGFQANSLRALCAGDPTGSHTLFHLSSSVKASCSQAENDSNPGHS